MEPKFKHIAPRNVKGKHIDEVEKMMTELELQWCISPMPDVTEHDLHDVFRLLVLSGLSVRDMASAAESLPLRVTGAVAGDHTGRLCGKPLCATSPFHSTSRGWTTVLSASTVLSATGASLGARHCTCRFWPMRHARSLACMSVEGFQSGSYTITLQGTSSGVPLTSKPWSFKSPFVEAESRGGSSSRRSAGQAGTECTRTSGASYGQAACSEVEAMCSCSALCGWLPTDVLAPHQAGAHPDNLNSQQDHKHRPTCWPLSG